MRTTESRTVEEIARETLGTAREALRVVDRARTRIILAAVAVLTPHLGRPPTRRELAAQVEGVKGDPASVTFGAYPLALIKAAARADDLVRNGLLEAFRQGGREVVVLTARGREVLEGAEGRDNP